MRLLVANRRSVRVLPPHVVRCRGAGAQSRLGWGHPLDRSQHVTRSPALESGRAGQFRRGTAEQLYTSQIQPYFRAPHIYLGFPFRFLPERQLDPDHPVSGISDGVLISSRDGINWDRTFMEAFVRPGRDRRNWTDRNMIIAHGVVPTADDELSLYWVENFRHDSCHLHHGTLRMDGLRR